MRIINKLQLDKLVRKPFLMAKMPFILYLTSTISITYRKGAQMSTTEKQGTAPQDSDFFKMWGKQFRKIYNAFSGTQFRVFMHLCTVMRYDNVAYETSEQIGEVLQVKTPQSVRNAITELIKMDVVRRYKGNGRYMVNPEIAAKVELSTRKGLIKKYYTLPVREYKCRLPDEEVREESPASD